MTCTETRRKLPQPEGLPHPAIAEHLASCRACRAESEALKEVDRRLVRLAMMRRSLLQDQQAALDQLFPQGPPPKPTWPWRTATYWLLLCALVLGASVQLITKYLSH